MLSPTDIKLDVDVFRPLIDRLKNLQSQQRAYGEQGRFPFTKKFGNFPLGISVWEKRVPFVTSPILGRPGRLIDRERHGTGDKDNISVNGTRIFHWEVSTGKTGLP